jgi:DNA-binding IclR family transcriptional regulator
MTSVFVPCTDVRGDRAADRLRGPPRSGATGLAILAFLPEEERQALYAKGLERFTDRTLVTGGDLEEGV